jgi:alpha-amylase/alpha-mannosidase (GH57 family)
MTRVALLWHMHQPFYQDVVTGEHAMPWVRLHALKDYWGMVALLREFPEIRLTFNLVPSLLAQLGACARGEGHERHLEIGLKPADELTPADRAFCLDEFFHAHPARMIRPYVRYGELLARRDDIRARRGSDSFSLDELRDLQVWHKLAWIDPLYAESDARVRGLLAKGRGFSEEDKALLGGVERELLQRVIDEYQAAAGRGQVELSTSPFYHPILPLLCDSDVYGQAHPGEVLPGGAFRRPEDAEEQIRRAIALHETLFGTRPDGLWPPEGAVSDAMVPLVARAGFSWMATDEEILARTLGRRLGRDTRGQLGEPEALYRPYRVGRAGEDVACGFRDRTLSDLIGFVYSTWPPEAAAADFVGRVEEAGRRYASATGGGEATVFVILDGENAWEHYAGQGRPFLRALYGRLSGSPDLRTVTMREACRPASERLASIVAGSWVDGDLYVWIGHRDDQRAWGQLVEARRALDAPRPELAPEAMALATEEMLVAEGSDWFWWYGDDHSSEQDEAFDELFRRHVANVYRCLGQPVPDDLLSTNITTQARPVPIVAPTGAIHPTIDGTDTDYFEWLGAGRLDVRSAGGTMHGSIEGRGIARVEFGFDEEHLYVLVGCAAPVRTLLEGGSQLHVRVVAPTRLEVSLGVRSGLTTSVLRVRREGRWEALESGGLAAAADEVAEFRISRGLVGDGPGPTRFFVALSAGGIDVDVRPTWGPIEVVPALAPAGADWRA